MSLISAETGKTVAKANKAAVRSGTCQWTETFQECIWIPHDDATKPSEGYAYKIVIFMVYNSCIGFFKLKSSSVSSGLVCASNCLAFFLSCILAVALVCKLF